jgi:hypothetical protein
MYFIGGEIYRLIDPTFLNDVMEQYTQQQANDMAAAGATPEAIATKTAELKGLMDMFQNPLVRFAIYLIEILPIGVLVTLVSAALLRRREVLPA